MHAVISFPITNYHKYTSCAALSRKAENKAVLQSVLLIRDYPFLRNFPQALQDVSLALS